MRILVLVASAALLAACASEPPRPAGPDLPAGVVRGTSATAQAPAPAAPAPVAVATAAPARAPAPPVAAAAPPPAPAPLPAPLPAPQTQASNTPPGEHWCFLWPFCGADSQSSQAAAAPGAPQPQQPASANVGSSSGSGLFSGIFGSDSSDEDAGPQLGVNAYLWRATLDTLNFMPLASEDPVGGVIITDWYSTPDNQNERLKVTAYILDKRLRGDAIKVAVFRQTRTANGWTDAQTNPDTATKVENAILTRARQLHLGTTAQ